jgi:hypothetical protein
MAIADLTQSTRRRANLVNGEPEPIASATPRRSEHVQPTRPNCSSVAPRLILDAWSERRRGPLARSGSCQVRQASRPAVSTTWHGPTRAETARADTGHIGKVSTRRNRLGFIVPERPRRAAPRGQPGADVSLDTERRRGPWINAARPIVPTARPGREPPEPWPRLTRALAVPQRYPGRH